uniref:Uncharacterized protein n=1 Tax=Arion vulgaris TaxID=1028688 RepID=A0A0B7BPA8_9EUPU
MGVAGTVNHASYNKSTGGVDKFDQLAHVTLWEGSLLSGGDIYLIFSYRLPSSIAG